MRIETDRTSSGTAANPSRSGATYSWYVVAVLTVAYISSFIDRQILSLLVGPIKRDLLITDSEIALLGGLSFALFYTILGIPIGWLADRRSRRGIIALGVAAWSVMTAACGVAKNYGQLFAARVGVGVGEAALSPPAYSLIADYFPAHRLGRALGVYSLGIYLGSGIALWLGSWIVAQVSTLAPVDLPVIGTVRPWQLVFFAIGLPGLLIAALIRTIREPVRGAMTSTPSGTVPIRQVVGYLVQHRRAFLCHSGGYGLIALVNYGMAFWVPTFLMRVHRWPVTKAGFVYGILTMTLGVAGVVAGGYLGDVLLKRGYQDAKLRVGIIAAIGELISAFLYLSAPDNALLIGALMPSCFFAAFGFGAAAAGIQEITPAPMRAQASAFYLFIVNVLGLGIGPSAVALLTDRVFRDELAVGRSLLVVSIAGLVAAIIVFGIGASGFRRTAAAAATWQPTGSPK